MNIWIVISFIEFVLIVFLAKKLYDLGVKTLETEDRIDDALIIIQEKYKKMSSILDRPVFFDSVEVRQVVSDIYECQVALYDIAVSVGNAEPEEEEMGEEDGRS
jgi:hypothetical protein